MFFVVLLHSLLLSGVLSSSNPRQLQISWLLEVSAYGAVDIFALISGYVGFREQKRSFKIKPIRSLWTQAVFYGLATFILASLLAPSYAGEHDLFSALLPITHRSYWYLTAYVGLFFLMPILDAGIRELSEQSCHRGIFLAIALFSAVSIFSGDKFNFSSGYSIWWLAVLYFIGAAMKKCHFLENLSKRWCLIGIIACAVLTWTFKIFGTEFNILDFHFYPDFLVSYLSPTIVISSILYLKLFASLNIGPRFAKIISWAAPCAFAVYLLNCNPQISHFYIGKILLPAASLSTPVLFAVLIGFTLAFFIVAILVEKVRQTIIKFASAKKSNLVKAPKSS